MTVLSSAISFGACTRFMGTPTATRWMNFIVYALFMCMEASAMSDSNDNRTIALITRQMNWAR